MKFKDLKASTDKIHYMINAIFENNDHEEDEILIEYLYEGHYKVRLVDILSTELLVDDRYNCTVNIAIGDKIAVCEVLPDDKICDESYFVFQYNQSIPMHFESLYK